MPRGRRLGLWEEVQGEEGSGGGEVPRDRVRAKVRSGDGVREQAAGQKRPREKALPPQP